MRKKNDLNENEEILFTAGEKNNNVYLLFSPITDSSEEKQSNDNDNSNKNK